jgi:hypothetical protein
LSVHDYDAQLRARNERLRAAERLRDTLAAHRNGPDGVAFDSRAWIITARAADRTEGDDHE